MSLGVVLGTDLLAQWLSKADRKEQERLEKEAMAIYGDASPPTLERMLKERLGPSAMEGIPQDFGNRQARNTALQQILQMGLQGGMDPGSMLAMEEARRAGAQAASQGQQAVRQEFQMRGLGGAGEATLALQAQQAGADRTAMGDLQTAADSRARALQALATGGGMAAQAEGQDFDRAERIARSKDAIARFNSELATDAIQRDWNNQLGLMDRQYGATQTRAGQKGRDVARTQQRVGAYGQAVDDTLSSVGGAIGGMGGSPGIGNQAGYMTRQPVGQSVPYDPNDPRYRRPR